MAEADDQELNFPFKDSVILAASLTQMNQSKLYLAAYFQASHKANGLSKSTS